MLINLPSEESRNRALARACALARLNVALMSNLLRRAGGRASDLLHCNKITIADAQFRWRVVKTHGGRSGRSGGGGGGGGNTAS